MMEKSKIMRWAELWGCGNQGGGKKCKCSFGGES
jgi:hypothetical protein